MQAGTSTKQTLHYGNLEWRCQRHVRWLREGQGLIDLAIFLGKVGGVILAAPKGHVRVVLLVIPRKLIHWDWSSGVDHLEMRRDAEAPLVKRAHECTVEHCSGQGRRVPPGSDVCECNLGFSGPQCQRQRRQVMTPWTILGSDKPGWFSQRAADDVCMSENRLDVQLQTDACLMCV
eukprot:COSAG03_NODE_335_length_8907_cov_26.269301_7_plen_176_part_00